ncbi:MAG TPA: nuclear transport factor 2 family protein [Kofleriaceae bacterium]
MSTDDNVKLVKTTMDQFMKTGSPEPLLAAITEDAVIKAVIPDGTPISGEFRGRDGFLRYLTALHEVMEILEVETTDITASADHVVMLGTEKARVRRTGKLLDCEVATVFTIQGGKIARMVALADMTPIVDAYRA